MGNVSVNIDPTKEARINLANTFARVFDCNLVGPPEACDELNQASIDVVQAYCDHYTVPYEGKFFKVGLRPIPMVDGKAVVNNFDFDFVLPRKSLAFPRINNLLSQLMRAQMVQSKRQNTMIKLMSEIEDNRGCVLHWS